MGNILDTLIADPLRDRVGLDVSSLPGVGSLFSNPAEEDLIRAMEEAAAQAQAYRQPSADARQGALNAQLGLFDPTNQMLQAMGLPTYDLSQVAQSPITPELTSIGDPNAAPAPTTPAIPGFATGIIGQDQINKLYTDLGLTPPGTGGG